MQIYYFNFLYLFLASSCPAHSTCEKECVGYKCNCDDGYHKDGDECVPTCDENQCALPFGGGYPCDAREVCIDLCSGYKCECDVGYSGRKCCEMENVCNSKWKLILKFIQR